MGRDHRPGVGRWPGRRDLRPLLHRKMEWLPTQATVIAPR